MTFPINLPRMIGLAIVLCLHIIGLSMVAADPFIYYPLSPNALYQAYMRVSLASGQYQYFNDLPGLGSYGSYNGAFGISFDKTATVALVTAVESKKLRKPTRSTS